MALGFVEAVVTVSKDEACCIDEGVIRLFTVTR